MPRQWKVYLSGEIHSDDCGVNILGPEDKPFWKDHKGAQLNAIRTRTLIAAADVVVVRFGEQYRQWNAAFDAGLASAQGKPLIVLHPEEFTHARRSMRRHWRWLGSRGRWWTFCSM